MTAGAYNLHISAFPVHSISFVQNLSKQRLRNIKNCEKTMTCDPMICVLPWVFKTNDLPTLPQCFLCKVLPALQEPALCIERCDYYTALGMLYTHCTLAEVCCTHVIHCPRYAVHTLYTGRSMLHIHMGATLEKSQN